MSVAMAHVAIPTPARYMVRLVKHFEHRVAVQHDETTGHIAFPDAPCWLTAGDSHLDIRIEAVTAERLVDIRQVVDRHLKMVAAKETFDIEWTAAG